MSHRISCISCLFLLAAFPVQSQSPPIRRCESGPCSNLAASDRGPVFPTIPSKGKWESLDFKPDSNGSVSCGVVRYEISDAKPTLHLLCPGPQLYAPLRVHLALTWADAKEVPQILRTMRVDAASPVKFKSSPGNAAAEVTLSGDRNAPSQRQWIHFSKVNVALVLPQN
jgi:hypothetical protein